ncbi:MAG: hypothetical protein K6E91_03170 [Butyrivibrio sp.]|nr:hypothetical protein [Butyrivibrio sp.]
MINISTNAENKELSIGDVESFFNYKVTASHFSEQDIKVLSDIDDAVLLDKNTGAIQTPFGITDITHLSTGCKTVLCYLYLRRKETSSIILDVTECGYNALDVLFECVEKQGDSDSVFVLRHKQGLIKCKDREYTINGHSEKNLNKGVVLYG